MELEHKNNQNSLLLIDDDSIANYVHEIIILENTSFSGKINSCTNGKDGIEYLIQLIANNKEPGVVFPNYILLAINMPEMNGFEFIDEFKKFSNVIKANVKICMLTSSLNDCDKAKANGYKEIKHYLVKPLNPIEFEKILNTQ